MSDAYSVVSSAYNCREVFVTWRFKLLIQILKYKGPNREPWGTPTFTGFQSVNVIQFDPLPPILQVIPHQLQCLIC